jgi:hypothetical protein
VKRPTEPFELECIALPGDYWNYDYSDEERWHSFKLTYPGVDQDIIGYVERKTSVGNELDTQLNFSEWVGVTLMVSFAKGDVHKGYPQVRIHDILGRVWLKGTAKDAPKAADLLTAMTTVAATPSTNSTPPKPAPISDTKPKVAPNPSASSIPPAQPLPPQSHPVLHHRPPRFSWSH